MQGARVRSWAHDSWSAMRDSLHDGVAEDVVRSHGVSFAAAALTLLVSLLLVHRQDPGTMLSSPMPNSMVCAIFAHNTSSPFMLSLKVISQTEAKGNVKEACICSSHGQHCSQHVELSSKERCTCMEHACECS